MDAIGLSAKTSHQKVFFLDGIYQGGGPEFLMKELIQTYNKPEDVPGMHVIAINRLNNPKMFEGQEITVDATSLDMMPLGIMLDKVSHITSYERTTPDFPAWRWHHWLTDPTILPVGEGAKKVNQMIRDYWDNKADTVPGPVLYNQDCTLENVPAGTDKEKWEIRFSYYELLDSTDKAFFDQHFDLNDLYGENNILAAKNLINKIEDEEEKSFYLKRLTMFLQEKIYDMDFVGLLSSHIRSKH